MWEDRLLHFGITCASIRVDWGDTGGWVGVVGENYGGSREGGERLSPNIGMVYNYTTGFYTIKGRGEEG